MNKLRQPGPRAAASKAHLYKAGIAAAVIVLCTAWLGYQWLSGPPRELQVKPQTPAAIFLAAASAAHNEDRYEYVIMVASEDGAAVDVSGKVASESDLRELRERFDAIAAATPGVTMTFTVTVGRIP